MASKKSTSSSKQRSQGGGRTANSEPRLQVFSQFSGCNFELSPRSFTLGIDEDDMQSDLAMNYVAIQNNVSVESNKTLQTRNKIEKLFDSPAGKNFTDASILVGERLYIATTDGDIYYGNIAGSLSNKVTLDNKTGSAHHWESLEYFDDRIIGTTLENQLWTSTPGNMTTMANAKKVPDPSALPFSALTGRGKLTLSQTMTDECCFRVGIGYSYVNKYGPTKCSEQVSFYTNIPVDEWHSGQYLQIAGTAPTGYDIQAVELYFTTGNSSSMMFCGRVDLSNGGAWRFNFVGYLDATSMWPIANLVTPEENYTEGVPASRCTCIDGRMYFWGSTADPYRLYIGGNPGNLFSVSSGVGGGFVDVEPGSGQEIRYVDKYKTQSGNSIVTMLCDSPNSTNEQRFNLVENSVTISNEQSMKSWQAEQVAGAVGCKSFHGGLVAEDGLYSVSRYGIALTTMTMEYNSQIRANYVSDPVKPVFTDPSGYDLRNAVLLEVDGILYFAMGDSTQDHLDNMLFCYDIDGKAWWTYTLDVQEPIINLIHIDSMHHREGIGIITEKAVYLLPTTQDDAPTDKRLVDVNIQTGELAAQQPQQGWIHLTQLEFDFDFFVGDLTIELIGTDYFGRRINTTKHISHTNVQYGLEEFMRVDLKMRSYKLVFHGKCAFRMSHFMGKEYVMSNKISLVYGFDDSQSMRSFGDIHPTFKSYNDIRQAMNV